MTKVLRSTKGFKPYKTIMEIITLKKMIKYPFNHNVTSIFKKLNCIVLVCNRSEGETILIVKCKDLNL